LKLATHFLGGAAHTLRSLKLVGSGIRSDHAIVIAGFLQNSPALSDLDLSYNPLGKDGITVVAKALVQTPQLRRLGLAGCKLGPKGVEGLCGALMGPSATLTDLDIAFNDLGIDGAVHVANLMRVNRSLLRLNLR
jgi:Ran GTPase-activating protein (RanGAP) involved in mRNA processing and transport